MDEYLDDEIDLRSLLLVIYKRRWTILTVFALIVLTVTIHTFTTIPVYEATTRLIIEKENPNIVSIQEVMAVDATGSDYYGTQFEIIKSRGVARDVINILHLADSEEFFPKPKDTIISNLKQSIKDTIGFWIDSITSLLKTDEPDKVINVNERDSGLESAFISRIGIEQIRNSRVVEVSFQAKDPVLATKIVNTLAGSYVDQNLNTKLSAIKDAVKWLNDQIEEERRRVEKAEQALLRYKEENQIITDFSSDTEKVTAQKLAQLNASVVEAESNRVEAETRYRQAAAMEGNPDMLDSIPEVLNSTLIRQIKAMEVDLYKRMSELSKKYGQKHPQMVAIQSELDTVQKRKKQEIERVINSLKNEYMVALAREKSLKAALATQKSESLELNQKAIQYGVLQREAESARHMYELLINRFKETSLTEEMRTGNIRIIDKAQIPGAPVKPRKKLNIILAMVVGLMLGIFLAFLFEFLDNSIRLPEDVKDYLKIPYLGVIPTFSSNGAQPNKREADLVTLHSPMSRESEAFRGVRTSVLFSLAESEPKVILVSSTSPQEGKSFFISNLAITMAQAGNKIIVLDGDMRRPNIHNIFGITRGKGLSDILVGASRMREIITHTAIPNLDVIQAGTIPPNPSEILGSNRMGKLLEALQKTYNRIVIDSPPVMAVTDGVALSKFVDGVIYVIRSGQINREVIKSGLEQFQSANTRLLGGVLNGVNTKKDSYYYRYHYFDYYYSDEPTEEEMGTGNAT